MTPLELKKKSKRPTLKSEGNPKGITLEIEKMEAIRNSIQFQNGVPFNFKIGILSI